MGRVRLGQRVRRLERRASSSSCPACGPEKPWVVDERAPVDGEGRHVLVCERCGRDWTGRALAVWRFMWEAV